MSFPSNDEVHLRNGLLPPDKRRVDCYKDSGVFARDEVIAKAIHRAWGEKKELEGGRNKREG